MYWITRSQTLVQIRAIRFLRFLRVIRDKNVSKYPTSPNRSCTTHGTTFAQAG
jgi:hypothetical protein